MVYIHVRHVKVMVMHLPVSRGRNVLAGMSLGNLPQYTWGMSLTAASPTHRIISEYILF